MRNLNLVLSTLVLVTSLRAQAKDYLCFTPGAHGGGDFIQEDIAPKLAKRGVPFFPFATGPVGTVQDRAVILGKIVSEQLAKDPDFRCHLVGHCYGGIVARYAYNHIRVQHPTRGEIPLSDIVLSYTSLQSPQHGTPLGDQRGKFVDGIPDVPMEMSEGYSARFNSPDYPETYSPLPTGIPVYSYRTSIHTPLQSVRPDAFLGFIPLQLTLLREGRDTRNDGLIPLDSQAAGHVLADLELPHSFFAVKRHEALLIPLTSVDFFVQHWKFLNSTDPLREETLRAFLRSKHVLNED
jgi:hypothetical protein